MSGNLKVRHITKMRNSDREEQDEIDLGEDYMENEDLMDRWLEREEDKYISIFDEE